jgi:hypothetical protein
MTEREKYLNALISAQASGQKVSTEISEVISEWRDEVIHSKESPQDKAVRYAKEYKRPVLVSISYGDLLSELERRGFVEDLYKSLGIHEEQYLDFRIRAVKLNG